MVAAGTTGATRPAPAPSTSGAASYAAARKEQAASGSRRRAQALAVVSGLVGKARGLVTARCDTLLALAESLSDPLAGDAARPLVAAVGAVATTQRSTVITW